MIIAEGVTVRMCGRAFAGWVLERVIGSTRKVPRCAEPCAVFGMSSFKRGGCGTADAIVRCATVLYCRVRMQDHTESLSVGSRAVEFTLTAANRSGMFSLDELLRHGILVIEFLRGTW